MSKQVTKTDKSKGKEKKKEEVKQEEFPEMSGNSKFEFPDKSVYIGGYRQLTTGQKIREGKGRMSHPSPDGSKYGEEWYDGEWKNDKMEGYGVYHYSNGDIYEGYWANNMHNGYGKYTFTDGNRYEGEWKDHRMNGSGQYLDMKNIGWGGEFRNGSYHTKDQSDLVEEQRVEKKIEKMKEFPMVYFRLWEETFAKADKKTIKEQLAPFFAKPDTMGKYVNLPYPKFEEKTPEKWNDAFRWAFGQLPKAPVPGKAPDPKEINAPKVTITVNVPKDESELVFLDKECLLTLQVQEDLTSGQVLEVITTLDQRKIQLGLGYIKEIDKWQLIFFTDITEKVKK